MLDGGIYYEVNNYMFRPIAAIFRLLQFCSKSVIYMTLFEEYCNNLKMDDMGRNI